MKLKKLAILGLMATSIAFADNFVPKVTTDKKVVDYFHKLLPTTTISNIYTTPYPNTYALIMGSNIVYGNLNSNYLTAGHMFNVNTQADITDYLQKLITPKINISQINVSDALIAKAPTGVNKKLIVFIDPDCPYCRQLEAKIEQNGINKKADIYYMLMPLSMHPNAKAHTTNILCSTKPLQTLKEYMVDNNDNPKVTLTGGCNIEAVLERTAAVARNLSINGTPAIVTGDGTMIMGSDIEAISQYVNKK